MSGLKGDCVCKRKSHARVIRDACVNKFALLAKKCPNWAFYGVLGEFCTGCGVGGGVLGEFCTGCGVGGGVQGEFCTGGDVGGGVLGEFCTGCAVVDR